MLPAALPLPRALPVAAAPPPAPAAAHAGLAGVRSSAVEGGNTFHGTFGRAGRKPCGPRPKPKPDQRERRRRPYHTQRKMGLSASSRPFIHRQYVPSSWPPSRTLSGAGCDEASWKATGMRRAVACQSGRRWFDEGSFEEGGRRRGGEWQRSEVGPFPWEYGSGEGAWAVQDDANEVITFLTRQGFVQLDSSRLQQQQQQPHASSHPPSPMGSSTLRMRSAWAEEQGRFLSGKNLTMEEEWQQQQQWRQDRKPGGLFLGSVFDIRAFNGVDSTRSFCVVGFCWSLPLLSDTVADSVLQQGGEVLLCDLDSGCELDEREAEPLQSERLRLRVAVPLLWGVPPALDSLRRAIHTGGGIVHRCFYQWDFI